LAAGKTEERHAYHEKLKQGGFIENMKLISADAKDIDLGDDEDLPDNFPFQDQVLESPEGEFEVVDGGKYSVFVLKDEMLNQNRHLEVKRQK